MVLKVKDLFCVSVSIFRTNSMKITGVSVITAGLQSNIFARKKDIPI